MAPIIYMEITLSFISTQGINVQSLIKSGEIIFIQNRDIRYLKIKENHEN